MAAFMFLFLSVDLGLFFEGGPAMGAELNRAQIVQAVDGTLDHFHQAATKADGKTYFGFFAPEGVFMGTDATERWTVEEFKQYAMGHFDQGKGWTYSPRNRHVNLSPAGDVAWFDELLDNKNYGVCRGSGVLRKVSGAWKISQYHLTIPLPNDLAVTIVKLIRDQPAATK